jgi:UDP-N-acetylglucosamine--N-acetylmuramyl-(pentapeptide) pyrophosphoryl-undecaprenol N-acetylglucosamine transferase
VPIVVPRRAAFGEHVDDHQVEFVASLPDGEVTRAEPAALRALLDLDEQRRVPHDHAPAFCRGLDEQVVALLARRRDQR